jgi:ABC-type microcin C transport system permease subunit YejB
MVAVEKVKSVKEYWWCVIISLVLQIDAQTLPNHKSALKKLSRDLVIDTRRYCFSNCRQLWKNIVRN